MEKLLTVKETADILNVRVMQVYYWISEGIIPAVRIGRKIRLALKSLDRLLQMVKII